MNAEISDAFTVTCTFRFSANCSAQRRVSSCRLEPQEEVLSGELLTMEQVRRAVNIYLESVGLPREFKERLYRKERKRQAYYRNARAAKSHRKTRKRRLLELEIDVDRIKSILPKPPK